MATKSPVYLIIWFTSSRSEDLRYLGDDEVVEEGKQRRERKEREREGGTDEEEVKEGGGGGKPRCGERDGIRKSLHHRTRPSCLRLYSGNGLSVADVRCSCLIHQTIILLLSRVRFYRFTNPLSSHPSISFPAFAAHFSSLPPVFSFSLSLSFTRFNAGILLHANAIF